MLLRHATPAKNLDSIHLHGLLASKSKGKLKACWLHTLSKSAWAQLHTVKRHNVVAQDVVILEVNVPRAWLRRSRKGLWYCPQDVPRDRLGAIITFDQLSASPVADEL